MLVTAAIVSTCALVVHPPAGVPLRSIATLRTTAHPLMAEPGFKLPGLDMSVLQSAIDESKKKRQPNGGRGPKPNPRFPDEKILDEGLLDPVFDGDSPYTGRISGGFTVAAETLNGRVAMLGFVALFLLELITGRGLIQLCGLPYDAGAPLAAVPGTDLFSVILAWVARALTVGSIAATVLTVQKMSD